LLLSYPGKEVGMTNTQRDTGGSHPLHHFGTTELRTFEKQGDYRTTDPAAAEAAVIAISATALSWVGHGEDTYIPYVYVVDGLVYRFLYLTPYDELHRAFGNHPAEWYDELRYGVRFEVAYDPGNPSSHRVLDPRFQPLNGRAMFAGTLSAEDVPSFG